MRAAVLFAAAALVVTGCDSGEEGAPAPKDPTKGARAKTIRAWSKALNAGEYERAAAFFAKGAVVEQTREFVLRDRDAAEAFNRSLPCRADVTDVDDEGATVLAAFRLRDGPGGRCEGGSARVRFRFKGGKFSEWRQLAAPETPEGGVV